jgi:hypothetical protein
LTAEGNKVAIPGIPAEEISLYRERSPMLMGYDLSIQMIQHWRINHDCSNFAPS